MNTDHLKGVRYLCTILTALSMAGRTAEIERVLNLVRDLTLLRGDNEFAMCDLHERAETLEALAMACAEAMAEDSIRKVTVCALMRTLDSRFELKTVKTMCDSAVAVSRYVTAMQDDNWARTEAERQHQERGMQIAHLFETQRAVRRSVSEFLHENLAKLEREARSESTA